MPYNLNLPQKLTNEGWKVKIFQNEGPESPHVTIIHRKNMWRWGLRERRFLDKAPLPKHVSKTLVKYVEEHRDALVAQWDQIYPENPVESQDLEEN